MSEPNNGQMPTAAISRTRISPSRLALIEYCRRLVSEVGYQLASQLSGVKVMTLYQWKKRFGWKDIAPHAQALDASKLSESAAAHDETLRKINKAAKLHYAVAALKAGVEASGKTGKALMQHKTALAFNQNAQAADRTLGWTAERSQPQVAVAVKVEMPTPEQDKQRQALHDKLDEITRRLAASDVPPTREDAR